MLLEALEHLAACPNEQERYLATLGVAPVADELALELDDVLPTLREELPSSAISVLDELERHLSNMSGADHQGLWTVSALQEADEWIEARRLASTALRLLRDDGC